MNVAETARRLVAHRAGHLVTSLYLDLDPERFATDRARSTQVTSLLDEAAREVEHDTGLDHDDLISVREDLERLREYLLLGDPPVQGAGALAVFCSTSDELFETVKLPRPVPGRVVIDQRPYVEPLLEAVEQRIWCVVLVSRRIVRVFAGPPHELEERQNEEDDVHGQHDQGGWSQARYQRSIEKDVDDHLRRGADLVVGAWRAGRFDRIALGGPIEIVPRFEAMLPEEVRPSLAPGRVEVDVSTATEDEIRRAVSQLVQEDQKRLERQALDKLAEGIGSGGRAAGGPEATLEALNERRVEKLLLDPAFDRPAVRCRSCGLLLLEGSGACPADGGELEPVEHLREAVAEAALGQDARIMVIRQYPDLGPFQGIAALLRF